MACCPLPLNESFAQVRNEEMRRTTPAKPSEPVEPAPPLANDQGAARPRG